MFQGDGQRQDWSTMSINSLSLKPAAKRGNKGEVTIKLGISSLNLKDFFNIITFIPLSLSAFSQGLSHTICWCLYDRCKVSSKGLKVIVVVSETTHQSGLSIFERTVLIIKQKYLRRL